MAQQRRSSMDRPISFQDFQSEFDRQEPRMSRIVLQLLLICEKTRTRKEGVSWKAKRVALGSGAAFGAGAAVLGLAFAPFTGGLSLVVAAAGAAGAAAAGVVLYDRITDRRTLDEVKEMVEKFCDAAKLLKEMEDERRKMLKKLDHEPEDVFIIHTMIEKLRFLYIIFTSDTTLERLLEVTQQCRRILVRLEVVRRCIREVDSHNQ